MPLKVLHVSSGNLYGGVETLLATLSPERFPNLIQTKLDEAQQHVIWRS
jgi:hypothetical protein